MPTNALFAKTKELFGFSTVRMCAKIEQKLKKKHISNLQLMQYPLLIWNSSFQFCCKNSRWSKSKQCTRYRAIYCVFVRCTNVANNERKRSGKKIISANMVEAHMTSKQAEWAARSLSRNASPSTFMSQFNCTSILNAPLYAELSILH